MTKDQILELQRSIHEGLVPSKEQFLELCEAALWVQDFTALLAKRDLKLKSLTTAVKRQASLLEVVKAEIRQAIDHLENAYFDEDLGNDDQGVSWEETSK